MSPVSSATPPRVALYARYSSDRQSEHSVEDQFRICREHAARQGWTVMATFQDAALSGSSTRRPGFQALGAAMRRGDIDIVLAEALDRFSRDQEHVAAFYKLAGFASVRVVTLAEGEISALHVGLKGTMNALYLQDLAAKTRRGIAGRVQAGKCFGPPPYGYRRITGRLRADGELERGLREIDLEEAAVVRRIFAEYAAGLTPFAICRRLNSEGVPSPSGAAWGPVSLRGRPTRSDGILRNRAYIGETVWNRRTRVVDPATGRVVRRLNPAEARVTGHLPELRIIDDATWNAVQRRLDETASAPDPETGQPRFWQRRAPEYLLSGKVRCGACGGNFAMMSGGFLRCTTAQRHLCSNRASIRRERLEAQVLDVMAEQLMEPALAAAFAEAFTEEWNRLAAEAGSQSEGLRRELAVVERKLANLIDALAEGLRSPGVAAKLAGLEADRDRLTLAIRHSQPTPIRLIPNLGVSYRRVLAGLRERLSGPGGDPEAMAIARQLIERVVIHPSPPRKPPGFTVEGHIARILTAAQPSLPDHVAESIANTAQLSDKEEPGGHCPLAGGVREGRRPSRSRGYGASPTRRNQAVLRSRPSGRAARPSSASSVAVRRCASAGERRRPVTAR
jgi:DNA invertase Pin-like site-specific DNA recombinase